MQTKSDFYRILVTVVISLLYFNSYSQKNYLPGYVINHSGDTVYGLVDYRNWKTCPEFIGFKEDPGQQAHDLYPSQISGFSVAGRIYESAFVEIEISPTMNQRLSYEKDFILRTDSVFLQARFRGTRSLYLFIDNDRKDQFYVPNDTSFTLLAYKKYLVEKGNESKLFLAENKKYVGQLTDYLRECPSLKTRIEKTGYYRASVEKLFKEYSKCTGEKYEFIRKDGERRVEFGFIAGATMLWTSLEGNPDKYIASVDMGLSTNVTFGMLFDFFQYAKSRKWSWSNEFLLTSYKYEGQQLDYTDTNNYTQSYIKLGGGFVKWHSLVRYKIPAGKFFLFADAGPSIGFGGMGQNEVYKERNFYGQMRYSKITAIEDTKRTEIGATAGIGIRYKRFTFESRYEFASGIVDNEDLSSNSNRLYFLLGIRL